MNNRSVLTLIEQSLAVLILCIAAAVCLKVLAYSSSLSDETEDISNACICVQNAAEVLKSASGDFEKTAQILGWNYEDGKVFASEEGLDI